MLSISHYSGSFHELNKKLYDGIDYLREEFGDSNYQGKLLSEQLLSEVVDGEGPDAFDTLKEIGINLVYSYNDTLMNGTRTRILSTAEGELYDDQEEFGSDKAKQFYAKMNQIYQNLDDYLVMERESF